MAKNFLQSWLNKPVHIFDYAFTHACVPPLIIFYFLAQGLWFQEASGVPLTLAVFLTGAGGGVLSTYFRLKDISPSKVSSNAILQIYMTPIISGVLGWTMYGLFLTGVLQGALFPAFTVLKGDNYQDLSGIFDIVPKLKMDAAKSLLWAFVAGFSEKLIPNILDRLADQVDVADSENDKLKSKPPADVASPTPTEPPSVGSP